MEGSKRQQPGGFKPRTSRSQGMLSTSVPQLLFGNSIILQFGPICSKILIFAAKSVKWRRSEFHFLNFLLENKICRCAIKLKVLRSWDWEWGSKFRECERASQGEIVCACACVRVHGCVWVRECECVRELERERGERGMEWKEPKSQIKVRFISGNKREYSFHRYRYSEGRKVSETSPPIFFRRKKIGPVHFSGIKNLGWLPKNRSYKLGKNYFLS